MSLAASRKVALRALAEIRRRGAYSRPVVDAVLARSGLSVNDAAFASRLAYTVVSGEGVLDDVIDGFAKRPGAIEPQVRDALRLSVAEILFLRTPSRAAVHQGVEAVRSVRPAAAGFANAVLRKVAERAESFPWGDPVADRSALARTSAMPEWLTGVFLEDLGDDAGREALEAGTTPPPLFVRVNPFRATVDDAVAALASDAADPTPAPPDVRSIRCAAPSAAVRGRALGEGLVLVVDGAAQVAPLACDPRPGTRILDVGAGRGTKTAVLQGLAHAAGGTADITAVDIHPHKLETLRDTLEGLGIPLPSTVVTDASDPHALARIATDFDVVLIDAPCSGLGTLRRHPEKRWRLVPQDVQTLADLQASLLEAAADVVRPGGLVVYSTCTITLAENQRVVSSFLEGERGRAFQTDSIAEKVPVDWQEFITPEGWFRSWPRVGDADGHFVAALRRTRA